MLSSGLGLEASMLFPWLQRFCCVCRCLEYLLRNDANPGIRDNQGYNAVHYASAYGHRLCLELVRTSIQSTWHLTATMSLFTCLCFVEFCLKHCLFCFFSCVLYQIASETPLDVVSLFLVFCSGLLFTSRPRGFFSCKSKESSHGEYELFSP